MATNVLTKAAIDALRPTAKRQKVFDGQGMYLQVDPNGSKLRRLK